MSTIEDVCAAVRDILVAEDPTTKVFKGERYLKSEGGANRVIFVLGDGQWTGAPKIAAKLCGAVGDSCDVYIWGRETKDDFTRNAAALALRARVIGALHRVAPGQITPGAVRRNQGTNVLTYGEEYVLTFTYREDIAAVKSIALLAAPNGPTSPTNPLKPNGDTGL
ncbi:MAG: hypothetical protein WCJ30_17090, partial [Deltaproteobacteria bacterium]